MPERPLLIFPDHTKARRDFPKRNFGSTPYHYPPFQIQKDRLTPQFKSMYQSFITDATEGLESESVLVIETIGKIDNFQRAVRAITGLEWLAEIDEEDIEPDEEYYQICKIGKRLFYEKIDNINSIQSSQIWNILQQNGFIDKNGYVRDKEVETFKQYIPDELSEYSEKIIFAVEDKISENKDKEISGRLYLSMSNKHAMKQVISLWNQWDSRDKKLPRGFGIWTEIFKCLKSVRRWDIQDRLRETGIIEYWQEELKIKEGTASKIPFEIELWYKKDNDKKRRDIQEKLEKLISEGNGNVIASCTINEIHFHAIRAELPPDSIKEVINSEYTRVFRSNDVMFFRPVGQCSVEIYPEGEEGDFRVGNVSGDPVVAIFDGDPFVNHALLENRLILDDSDDFGNAYQANERKHGTAMASLICHGELDAKEEPLLRPVYFRPIMKPDPEDFINQSRTERIPKEYFLEDLIERSVRRIFEGDGTLEAVAPTVKIINLSISDSSRMFFNQLSSGAKLLDWLSEKYQVLFCVSAGNIKTDIDLEQSVIDIQLLDDDDLLKLTMGKIQGDIRNRKLFAPADSINSITIGALHTDKSNITNLGNRIDLLPNQVLPSPVSTHGHGFRNSIKPEIYFPGGRQLYNHVNRRYKISGAGAPPGQFVATTPVTSGEKGRCVYTRGTSNATALATRGAAQIFEVLNELNISDEKNIAVLLKALLIHSASWGNSYDDLETCLKNQNNSHNFRKIVSRYIGYGIPDINRVIECTAQRATAIGYGKIKKDEKHDFKFPIPPSLSGSNERRRLTTTLAWFSPINTDSRKFRKANLSINPSKDDIGVERKDADWQQVKNGTVQHEILEGSKVVDYQDGDALIISVICREDAGNLDETINYGLAVTLEVAEGINLPIYEEIKERIIIAIPVEESVQ